MKGAALLRTAVVVTLALAIPGAARTSATGAPLAGHWEGAFSRLGSIQLVALDLDTTATAPPRLRGSFDIPALGLFGEPLDSVVVGDSTLSFRLTYGRFLLRLRPEDLEMTGVNRDWRPAVNLHLNRVPRPATAFDTVGLAVSRAGATIRGTLYMPRAGGRVPSIVVAGGASQTTRQPWRYRAWGPVLASRGIAVLLYDRRGNGASGGKPGDPDLRAEADDVIAMVERLRRHPALDPARLGVAGLSRGGWVATWAAAHSPGVRFVVLECGAAVSPTAQEIQRVEHSALGDSLTVEDVVKAADFTRLTMRAALGQVPWADVERVVPEARAARWNSIVQIPERPADLDWWRRNEIDQAAVLRAVRVPVLALFGSDDDLVPVAENATPMREALVAGGNRAVDLRIVPRAGHGLFRGARLEGGDWKWPDGYWVWSAKAPGVYEEVGDWVLAR